MGSVGSDDSSMINLARPPNMSSNGLILEVACAATL